jgi:hypothetical protein
LCTDETRACTPEFVENYPLIVNHSKNCYIDKRKVSGDIHPLPLLTMETVVYGSGDYRGINQDFRGMWARDSISVEKTVPEGYKKVKCNFKDHRDVYKTVSIERG